MAEEPCNCTPPDMGLDHFKSLHAYDCGGQTFDPPCGGCIQCQIAQYAYYAGTEQQS